MFKHSRSKNGASYNVLGGVCVHVPHTLDCAMASAATFLCIDIDVRLRLVAAAANVELLLDLVHCAVGKAFQ